MLKTLLAASVCLGFALPIVAQDSVQMAIKGATAAGPASISDHARVVDWTFKELRPGTNDWVCLTDNPETPGPDPMCITEPWLNLLNSYVNKEAPTYTNMGIAYMLAGEGSGSNTDPYATEPTDTNEWIESVDAHIMILVPDKKLLESFPTDHRNGGPWVMWSGTPYAHLMVPVASGMNGMMGETEHEMMEGMQHKN